MFASYHLPPQQFRRDPASLYQPTTQSPSFHQPRHTLHFSILSILLILSKNLYTFYTAEIGYWQGEGLTTEDGGQRIAVRPARPTVSVYSVYFVVQISASFALFAAEGFTLLNQFYSSSDSSRRASFRAGFLRVSITAYTFTKPSDSL